MDPSLAFYSQLLSTPAFVESAVVLVVLLLERYWQLPEHYNPLILMRMLAARMSSKVKPKTLQNHSQHLISGGLGWIMLIAPWVIILYILHLFAFYPLFFDALLLFICVQYSSVYRRFDKTCNAIRQGKRQLAKDSCAPMLLRGTQILSDIGIFKACSETLLLRVCYQQICVLFWFIVGGPFVALFYRLSYEVLQVWNPKNPKFALFGKPVALFCQWMQWIPVRMHSLLSMLVMRGLSAFRKFNQHSFLQNLFALHGALILRSQSAALDLHLSGAVMYGKHKIRRPKYTGLREPHVNDQDKVKTCINRGLVAFVVVLLMLYSLVHSVGIMYV